MINFAIYFAAHCVRVLLIVSFSLYLTGFSRYILRYSLLRSLAFHCWPILYYYELLITLENILIVCHRLFQGIIIDAESSPISIIHKIKKKIVPNIYFQKRHNREASSINFRAGCESAALQTNSFF